MNNVDYALQKCTHLSTVLSPIILISQSKNSILCRWMVANKKLYCNKIINRITTEKWRLLLNIGMECIADKIVHGSVFTEL